MLNALNELRLEWLALGVDRPSFGDYVRDHAPDWW
jgi:hypothetical protein